MKKEYLAVFIIALIILSSVLDFLAGPFKPVLKNPFDFFQPAIISVYPFTAVSIGIKTILIFTGVLLVLSLIAKKYLAKGIFLLFLIALLELYSIQQLATGSRMVTLEWSLALAYTGIILLLPTVIFIIIGIIKSVHQKLTQTADPYSTTATEEVE